MFGAFRACRLNANIVESVKNGENERSIMTMFEDDYRSIEYPPKELYRTVLCCCAVSFDHKELVKYLLATEYNVNYECGHVTPSPLHVAVHLGREECIRLLLNAGARVDKERCFSGEGMTEAFTALELAMMSDRRDLVELMIPLYSRKNTRTQRTPLHLACLHGARQCLDYILSTAEGQNDVNVLDRDDPYGREGYVPLMMGLHQGAWFVQRILQAGGDARQVTCRLKNNALHICCWSDLAKRHLTLGFVPQDLPKIVQLLIEAGCDPNISNKCGETPLTWLCAQVRVELKRPDRPFPYDVAIHRKVVLSAALILLEHGANPDGDIRHIPLSVLVSQLETILRQFTCTVVDDAVMEMCLLSMFQAVTLARDLFQLLLQRGANPNIIDSHGRISKYIVDSLFLVLRSNTNYLMGIQSHWAGDVVGVFADIFRLLLLYGGKLHESVLVFQVFCQEIPGKSLFLAYYLNYFGRPNFDKQLKRVHEQLKDAGEARLAELEGFTQGQPIRLLHLVRVAVLRSVGSQAVRVVPTLELPTALKDYILSLK